MKRIGTVVILTAILLMTACSRSDTGSSVADSGMTKIQNVDNSNGSKTDDQPEITQNADNRNGSKTEGWAEVSQNAENSNGSTTDDKAEVTQDIDSSIGNNADGAEGNKADTAIEDGYSLEGDELATEVTQEEIDQLREMYPEYFDLPDAKGLEVFVWEMAEGRYSCGVLMGTNRVKFESELMGMRGVSVDTMRKILASYDCGEDYIFIGYYQHPLSSYVPLDIDAEYAKIKEMFADLPKIVGAADSVSGAGQGAEDAASSALGTGHTADDWAGKISDNAVTELARRVIEKTAELRYLNTQTYVLEDACLRQYGENELLVCGFSSTYQDTVLIYAMYLNENEKVIESKGFGGLAGHIEETADGGILMFLFDTEQGWTSIWNGEVTVQGGRIVFPEAADMMEMTGAYLQNADPDAENGDIGTLPGESGEIPNGQQEEEVYEEIIRYVKRMLSGVTEEVPDVTEAGNGKAAGATLEEEEPDWMIGITETGMGLSVEEKLQHVGYVLTDVDGNGVRELIIGEIGEGDVWNNRILAMFTVAEGKAVNLISGWARNRYYLVGGRLFLNNGSWGAANTCYGIECIGNSGSEMILKNFFFSDFAGESSGSDDPYRIAWFTNTTRSGVSSESMMLNEKESSRLLEYYENMLGRITELNLIPVADFE